MAACDDFWLKTFLGQLGGVKAVANKQVRAAGSLRVGGGEGGGGAGSVTSMMTCYI